MSKTAVFIALILLLAGCSTPTPSATHPPLLPIVTPSETHPPTHTPLPTDTPTPTQVPSITPTATVAPTDTPVLPPTDSATPPATSTVTSTPTPIVLLAEVRVQANCRYGPGAMYLYKYGLFAGSNIEVDGRTDKGDWVLIRATGDTEQCWVRTDLLEVWGDVMNLQPTYIPLPQSPSYGPVTGVAAVRDGDQVTITWNLFVFQAGDEPDDYSQLVEAWVCQEGELVFTPVGTFDNFVTLTDEAGCTEPSHARVYGVEKHGYTSPVEVPWPAHE